jgi:uncharacterized membrane protein
MSSYAFYQTPLERFLAAAGLSLLCSLGIVALSILPFLLARLLIKNVGSSRRVMRAFLGCSIFVAFLALELFLLGSSGALTYAINLYNPDQVTRF